MSADTTADTIQHATRSNGGQAPARRRALISRLCNVRQHSETDVSGLWLRRARVRVPSVTFLDESWAVLLLVLHSEVLHPKILLELSPATKPDRERSGKGTSSREVEIQGTTFTVGVLLLTNYGNRHQLSICGAPVGRTITDLMPEGHNEGSCIGVVATDAPLHPRQLKRLARRVDVGLGRTGSVGNDGSGEIFIAFSTANRIPRGYERSTYPIEVMIDGAFWTQGAAIDRLFEAVAEATEEAALNALFMAETVTGRGGHVLHALPIDRTLDLLRGWHPV
jgi:hypothetical protein